MICCDWLLWWWLYCVLGFWAERTEVHKAACQGQVSELQSLIQSGASVNIVAVDSITPLHEAAARGQTQCVRLLLDAGAQVPVTHILFLKRPQTTQVYSESWLWLWNGVLCCRLMQGTWTEALHCVKRALSGTLSVWGFFWSMEQKSTPCLPLVPPLLYMRPAWEVCCFGVHCRSVFYFIVLFQFNCICWFKLYSYLIIITNVLTFCFSLVLKNL